MQFAKRRRVDASFMVKDVLFVLECLGFGIVVFGMDEFDFVKQLDCFLA